MTRIDWPVRYGQGLTLLLQHFARGLTPLSFILFILLLGAVVAYVSWFSATSFPHTSMASFFIQSNCSGLISYGSSRFLLRPTDSLLVFF